MSHVVFDIAVTEFQTCACHSEVVCNDGRALHVCDSQHSLSTTDTNAKVQSAIEIHTNNTSYNDNNNNNNNNSNNNNNNNNNTRVGD